MDISPSTAPTAVSSQTNINTLLAKITSVQSAYEILHTEASSGDTDATRLQKIVERISASYERIAAPLVETDYRSNLADLLVAIAAAARSGDVPGSKSDVYELREDTFQAMAIVFRDLKLSELTTTRMSPEIVRNVADAIINEVVNSTHAQFGGAIEVDVAFGRKLVHRAYEAAVLGDPRSGVSELFEHAKTNVLGYLNESAGVSNATFYYYLRAVYGTLVAFEKDIQKGIYSVKAVPQELLPIAEEIFTAAEAHSSEPRVNLVNFKPLHRGIEIVKRLKEKAAQGE